MTTEIAVVADGVHPEEWVCEVYRGTGGMCLFVRRRDSQVGAKFWVNDSNRVAFEHAVERATRAV